MFVSTIGYLLPVPFISIFHPNVLSMSKPNQPDPNSNSTSIDEIGNDRNSFDASSIKDHVLNLNHESLSTTIHSIDFRLNLVVSFFSVLFVCFCNPRCSCPALALNSRLDSRTRDPE